MIVSGARVLHLLSVQCEERVLGGLGNSKSMSFVTVCALALGVLLRRVNATRRKPR